MIKKLALLFISGYFLSCSTTEKEENTSTSERQGSQSNYVPSGFHASINHGKKNQPVSLLLEDSLYHLYYTTGTDELGHLKSVNLLDWDYDQSISIGDSYGKVQYDLFNSSGLSEPWIKYWVDDNELIISTSADGKSNWNDRSVLKTEGFNPSISWDSNLEQWILVLTNGNKLEIHTSVDFLRWESSSEIVYETPLQSASLSQIGSQWLFVLNQEEIKYQIGSFDGASFIPLGTPSSLFEGSNFQSANLFHTGDKTLLIAQSEKNTNSTSPTFSLPLEVDIKDENILLFPTSHFRSKFTGKRRGKLSKLVAEGPSWYSFTIDQKFSNLKMILNDPASSMNMEWDTERKIIKFDRSKSSIGDLEIIESNLSIDPDNLKVDILIDHDVIDIFFNDGEAYFSISVKPFSFFSEVQIYLDDKKYDARGVLFNIGI
ncbi:GH32 C-terminal domain-containing protein [Ekhidna sp.]